jgi:hypothetical protein
VGESRLSQLCLLGRAPRAAGSTGHRSGFLERRRSREPCRLSLHRHSRSWPVHSVPSNVRGSEPALLRSSNDLHWRGASSRRVHPRTGAASRHCGSSAMGLQRALRDSADDPPRFPDRHRRRVRDVFLAASRPAICPRRGGDRSIAATHASLRSRVRNRALLGIHTAAGWWNARVPRRAPRLAGLGGQHGAILRTRRRSLRSSAWWSPRGTTSLGLRGVWLGGCCARRGPPGRNCRLNGEPGTTRASPFTLERAFDIGRTYQRFERTARQRVFKYASSAPTCEPRIRVSISLRLERGSRPLVSGHISAPNGCPALDFPATFVSYSLTSIVSCGL